MPDVSDKPFWKGFFEVFQPMPELTVDEWAALHRVLPQSGSATPGIWRNERTPYLVEIMRELSPQKKTEEIVFCKGSQIGATECAVNWMMYNIDMRPGPFLLIEPTIDMAEKLSKQRIGPSFAQCKKINEKIPEGRREGNSLLEKIYPGGFAVISCAGSPAALSSMPIRDIVLDEIDRYPFSAGKEGDPKELAAARQRTFFNRKRFILSSPAEMETSEIWKMYQDSDRRVYMLPCPHCNGVEGQPDNGYFELKFEHLQWEKGNPQTVLCFCPHCGGGIEEWQKTEMLANGVWIATNPGHWRAGFHLSALYSPVGWLSWKDVAKKFELAGNDPEKRKTFMNTILGLPWEESGETIANEYLERRKEQYACEIPPGVLFLTMAVDVQKDRLEYEVKGWGINEESWGIEYGVLRGSTTELISNDKDFPSPWQQLDAVRLRGYKRLDGTEMRIACAMVDAGYNSDAVYEYTKPRERMRVFAVRGYSTPNKPIMNRPSRNTKNRAAIFYTGTDTAKELIYSRLKIETPAPGYFHFPADDRTGYDAAFYAGLISEKRITVYRRGFKRLEWHKERNARNEPLDLAVYNLVAIRHLNIKWERFENQETKIVAAKETPKPQAKFSSYAPRQPGIALQV
jgi:phage terminase large subunit GpA-like protein